MPKRSARSKVPEPLPASGNGNECKVIYLWEPDHREPSDLARVQGTRLELRCGCPACLPDYWCDVVLPDGTRCNKPIYSKAAEPYKGKCLDHYRLLVRARIKDTYHEMQKALAAGVK